MEFNLETIILWMLTKVLIFEMSFEHEMSFRSVDMVLHELYLLVFSKW